MEIKIIGTEALTPHPRLERVWRMDDSLLYIQDVASAMNPAEIRENWEALVESIRLNGILEPLKVMEDESGDTYLILDGRHRYAAAVSLEMTDLPCVIVEPEDAEQIIIESVVGRRHWNKSQLAYFAVLMHPEVASSNPGRRHDSNSDFIGIRTAKRVAMTRTDLAKRFGVSADLIDQASKLFDFFEENEKLRKCMEPSIWAGAGLGGVLAGIAGKKATEGRQRNPTGIASANTALKSMASRLRNFAKWAEPERKIFENVLVETVAEMDAAARAMFSDAIARAEAEAAAKEGGAA